MRVNDYWTKQKKGSLNLKHRLIEIIHTKVYRELKKKKIFKKKREYKLNDLSSSMKWFAYMFLESQIQREERLGHKYYFEKGR